MTLLMHSFSLCLRRSTWREPVWLRHQTRIRENMSSSHLRHKLSWVALGPISLRPGKEAVASHFWKNVAKKTQGLPYSSDLKAPKNKCSCNGITKWIMLKYFFLKSVRWCPLKYYIILSQYWKTNNCLKHIMCFF